MILGLMYTLSFSGCIIFPGEDDPTPTPTSDITPTPTPDYTDDTEESTYSGSGDEVFHIDTTGNVDLTHTLHLGASTADVYYVFTNTSPSNDRNNPVIVSKSGDESLSESPAVPVLMDTGLSGIKGKPGISTYNKDVSGKLGTGAGKGITPPEPVKDTVGQSVNFYYDLNNVDYITATCRKVVDAGSRTLNIYVANDCWEPEITQTKDYEVTQAMVDAMADKFLLAASNNDIYNWVTGIYGPEWGTHPYPGDLISSATDEITILLYDIDNDNVPSGPFIMGFYWAKDNFLNSAQAGSNERLMFYIDAVMYAYPEGSWDITDYWPKEMISTLAHEFQHMIHFYQKGIASGNGGYSSDTWINEMCSMAAEDFVADKILADGPRGVAYNDPTAGSAGNSQGRIPLFNSVNDYSLTVWNSQLYNYSTVYAFGAYLSRNFGGTPLFQEIVQSTPRDSTVITSALSALGYGGEDFTSVLQKWGAAILLSDNYSQGGGYYQYNKNAYVTSTASSINYNLGSINLYNYDYSSQSGPYIYTSSPVGSQQGHSDFENASNRLYLVGSGLTGDVTHTVQMDEDVLLTVVVKE
jgi:hypothetical protein